jgi:RNA polymerase sigma-70 factor, ECF subfamily
MRWYDKDLTARRDPGLEDFMMSAKEPTRVEQALAWLQSGGPQDVERSLAVLQDAVFGFGMKVCGNPADAQDTAQETLLRLARSLKKFPNTRALSVWLYKVAKSQCLMSRRKSKFAPEHMLSLDELMPPGRHDGEAGLRSWTLTPEEALLRGEFRRCLVKAIRALPPPYRLVFVLRDMEQLDTRQVAELMEVSEDTVKMRLHRARVFVRNELDKYLRGAAGRSR